MLTDGGYLIEYVDQVYEEDEDFKDALEEVQPHEQTLISLDALEGCISLKTIRVIGQVRGKNISMLVDSGSRHNFVQEAKISELRLPVSPIKEFFVATGSGEKLCCNKVCRAEELVVQKHKFKVDLFVLPMAEANLVLGIQWLKTLGPITTDYSVPYMEFMVGGSLVRWMGNNWLEESPLSGGELKRLNIEVVGAFLFSFTLCSERGKVVEVSDTARTSSAMADVLTRYSDVFKEPDQLPPKRDRDHRIMLEENSKVVNVKPYRYPQFQKVEMESIVKELVQKGLLGLVRACSLL